LRDANLASRGRPQLFDSFDSRERASARARLPSVPRPSLSSSRAPFVHPSLSPNSVAVVAFTGEGKGNKRETYVCTTDARLLLLLTCVRNNLPRACSFPFLRPLFFPHPRPPPLPSGEHPRGAGGLSFFTAIRRYAERDTETDRKFFLCFLFFFFFFFFLRSTIASSSSSSSLPSSSPSSSVSFLHSAGRRGDATHRLGG